MNNNYILVSIVMLTYNHSEYIKEAIDSILMQDVDFKYEIIIGDDCSTDNTQEILLQYKNRYPNIFKLILRSENIGPTKNFYDVLMNCKGKYIAFLEGDDYWLDGMKLQKQFDFLEKTNHMAVYNDVLTVDENNNVHESYKYPSHLEKIYSIEDWKKWIIPGQIGGSMIKNIFMDSEEDYTIIFKAHSIIGDRTLALILSNKGNIYCDKEVLSAYRFVTDSGSSFSAQSKNSSFVNENYSYYRKLFDYYRHVTGQKLDSIELEEKLFGSSIERFKSSRNLDSLKLIYSTFSNLKHKTKLVHVRLIKLPFKLIKLIKSPPKVKVLLICNSLYVKIVVKSRLN